MTPSGAFIRLWLPAFSLCHREIIRFLRQRSRVLGALATPVLLWLVIGSGVGRSFQPATNSSVTYLEYTFPGTIALILLFTAVFSMISVIDDRREGFMQAVIAAPVSRTAIVLGKVLGCSLLAVGQAALFLLLGPLAGLPLTPASFALTILVMLVCSLALAGLGFLFAWPMDSTQGFHAIMNLLLIPMWLTSGAFFPISGASAWLAYIMRLNPMTYAVDSIRYALYVPKTPSVHAAGSFSFSTCLIITIISGAVLNGASIWMVSRTKAT